MAKNFTVKTLIYTTDKREWIRDDFAEILDTMRTAGGLEIKDFDVKVIARPTDILTVKKTDGEVHISWEWFKERFTKEAKVLGYNAVCFHTSKADKKALGIFGVNGLYRNDPDGTFEFWVCADKGQKSDRKQKDAPNITQFARVFLHEFAHGFMRWTDNANAELVHIADYEWQSIKSLYPKISFVRWSLLKDLLSVLTILVPLLEKKRELDQVAHKNKLEEWALAIQEFEGYKNQKQQPPAGSLSYQNNNPGNLRWSPFESGQSRGFSTFSTYQKGFDALMHQLRIATTGESKVYRPDMTLLRFFEVYAPSSDNNHPETYAKFVAKRLGVNVSIKISNLK